MRKKQYPDSSTVNPWCLPEFTRLTLMIMEDEILIEKLQLNDASLVI